jgi:hypothetical protein
MNFMVIYDVTTDAIGAQRLTKGDVFPTYAINAYKASRGTAPSILNLGALTARNNPVTHWVGPKAPAPRLQCVKCEDDY